jgi:hypothetical protein
MQPAMQPIESADLLAVGYDRERSELWVRFRTRPTLVYVYFDVAELVYRQLMAAESHGRFFHARVRDVYRVDKRDWLAKYER